MEDSTNQHKNKKAKPANKIRTTKVPPFRFTHTLQPFISGFHLHSTPSPYLTSLALPDDEPFACRSTSSVRHLLRDVSSQACRWYPQSWRGCLGSFSPLTGYIFDTRSVVMFRRRVSFEREAHQVRSRTRSVRVLLLSKLPPVVFLSSLVGEIGWHERCSIHPVELQPPQGVAV